MNSFQQSILHHYCDVSFIHLHLHSSHLFKNSTSENLNQTDFITSTHTYIKSDTFLKLAKNMTTKIEYQ